MAIRDPYQDEATMKGAVERQRTSANRIAEEGLKANAMERALAQGAAQGLAGKEGATGGQAAAVQAEIANKYAPQRSTIESQRQQALAAAAEQEFAIPTQMAGIRNQEVQNEYNRSLIKKPGTTYGSGGSSSSGGDKEKKQTIFDNIDHTYPVTDLQKIFGKDAFQIGKFIGTMDDWKALDLKTRLDNIKLQSEFYKKETPGSTYNVG